tara:strand:+ start:137 stop:304 length:168 start_codon:yes stop_codon:yes gene_type:complete
MGEYPTTSNTYKSRCMQREAMDKYNERSKRENSNAGAGDTDVAVGSIKVARDTLR